MIKLTIIFCEFISLISGVYLPLARIDEFWILSSEFSIISLSEKLILENEHTLGIIVILFGLIFPVFKIFTRLFNIKVFEKFNLHRFSMVDIFLLSFLIFMGKLSAFFEIELLTGFYFLLLSIFLGYIQIIFSNMIPK